MIRIWCGRNVVISVICDMIWHRQYFFFYCWKSTVKWLQLISTKSYKYKANSDVKQKLINLKSQIFKFFQGQLITSIKTHLTHNKLKFIYYSYQRLIINIYILIGWADQKKKVFVVEKRKNIKRKRQWCKTGSKKSGSMLRNIHICNIPSISILLYHYKPDQQMIFWRMGGLYSCILTYILSSTNTLYQSIEY